MKKCKICNKLEMEAVFQMRPVRKWGSIENPTFIELPPLYYIENKVDKNNVCKKCQIDANRVNNIRNIILNSKSI